MLSGGIVVLVLDVLLVEELDAVDEVELDDVDVVEDVDDDVVEDDVVEDEVDVVGTVVVVELDVDVELDVVELVTICASAWFAAPCTGREATFRTPTRRRRAPSAVVRRTAADR